METDRIKLDAAFYDLTQEVGGAIFSAMLAVQRRAEAQPDPPPPLLQFRRGYAESPAWLLIQIAEFDPEPLTLENLRVRHVYGSKRMFAALLELMASEDWLDRDSEGAYHPTAVGRAQYQRLRPRQHTLIGALEPPPEAQAERLAGLLGRVIDAGLVSPNPPGTWCLAHSRRRAPATDAPALTRIFHYSEDINAIRDDAHMAAWSSTGLKGYEWETFTHIYAGQANTAEMLFEQLNYRGNSRGEYASALAELARRGWLEPAGDAGAYQVTEAGKLMRGEIERATDEYFYTPWSCLSTDEITVAHDLLIKLCGGLQEAHS
jgi:hypothetical protein